MAFTTPDYATAAFAGQAVPDSTTTQAKILAFDGTYVVSGCAVTWSSGRTLAVASGTVAVGGTVHAVSAATVTVTAGSTSGDRRDIVTVSSSGTVSVTKGTPCSTTSWLPTSPGAPVKPAIPSTHVILAEVYVTGSASVLSSSCLVDKRVNVKTSTPTLSGDVTGSASSTTVGRIQGNTVASGTPSGHQNLSWTSTTAKWKATSAKTGMVAGTHVTITTTNNRGKISVTGGGATGLAQLDSTTHLEAAQTAAQTGDVTKTAGAATTVLAKIQGKTLTTSGVADGNTFVYHSATSTWKVAKGIYVVLGLVFDHGKTDNSATLQAAITAVYNAGGGTVLLPATTDMLGVKFTQLTLKHGVKLQGVGPTTPTQTAAPSAGAVKGTVLCGTNTSPAGGTIIKTATASKGAALRTLSICGFAATNATGTTPVAGIGALINARYSSATNVSTIGGLNGVIATGSNFSMLDVYCFHGSTPGIRQTTTTTTGSTSVKAVASSTGIAVGMMVMVLNRYIGSTPCFVTSVTTTSGTKKVHLNRSITTVSGDTVWFVGGVGWGTFGADSVACQSQTLYSTVVYGAGDMRGTQVHHSTSHTQTGLGYNGITYTSQSVEVHGTIDCGDTNATALWARVWGTSVFEGCRWQNGSATGISKTVPTLFPMVTDFGHDTSHGTIINGGEVPALAGRITKIIHYQGSFNPMDRIYPTLRVTPTSTTPSTLWNPYSWSSLTSSVPGSKVTTTVSATSNGGKLATVASWSSPSAGVLGVASNSSLTSSGYVNVKTKTGGGTVHYTGKTGTGKLTGCTYVSGGTTGTKSKVTTGDTVVQGFFIPGVEATVTTGPILVPGTYDVAAMVTFTDVGFGGAARTVAVAVVPSLSGTAATLTTLTGYPGGLERVSSAANSNVAQLSFSGRIVVKAQGTVDLVVEPASTYPGALRATANASNVGLSTARVTSLRISRVY